MPAAHPPVGAPAPAQSPARPGASKAAPGRSISGTVRLADALAGKIAPTDTLFIFARAETGSRMPLAIAKGGANELPRSFALDDTMGMSQAVKLSEAASVVVEARISRSGNAVPQPGDLVGVSKPVAPGATGVAIVIDKVVP
jgi:cytochrome c-type biogenesis protein CcmH